MQNQTNLSHPPRVLNHCQLGEPGGAIKHRDLKFRKFLRKLVDISCQLWARLAWATAAGTTAGRMRLISIPPSRPPGVFKPRLLQQLFQITFRPAFDDGSTGRCLVRARRRHTLKAWDSGNSFIFFRTSLFFFFFFPTAVDENFLCGSCCCCRAQD